MKWNAQTVSWTNHGAWDGEAGPVADNSAVATHDAESDVHRQAAGKNLATPLRIVGILAFCQMMIFLVLMLFICARAGAATAGKPGFKPELTASTYSPQRERDPFGAGALKPSDGSGSAPAIIVAAGTFKLNGILYHSIHPSAVVNGQLVELRKPVKVPTGQGEVTVEARDITREGVTLQVGSDKVELRLGASEADSGTGLNAAKPRN